MAALSCAGDARLRRGGAGLRQREGARGEGFRRFGLLSRTLRRRRRQQAHPETGQAERGRPPRRTGHGRERLRPNELLMEEHPDFRFALAAVRLL